MKNKYFLALLFISSILHSQIVLTHNIGDQPIETLMFSCGEAEYWARAFVLEDFNISSNDEFLIQSGEIAFSTSYGGATAQFNIYEIDKNFPGSFSESKLIGSSQKEVIPAIYSPQAITISFTNPILVPANIERILVEVKKGINPNSPATSTAYISGTTEETDISWYKGCGPDNAYTPSDELSLPRPNANFFLNVKGESNLSVIDTKFEPFTMYPNPVENKLNIKSQDKIKKVQIYSSKGIVIKETYTSNIDVSNLNPGIYFVQIITKDYSQIKKILKK